MDDHAPLPALQPLGRLLAARRVTPRGAGVDVDVAVSEDWLQGRTAYGGLTSAIGVCAMRDLPAPLPPGSTLRALQTSFVGPVEAGPVRAEVALLRDGKHVRQVQATLRQHDEVVAVMLGVFASDRSTTLEPASPTRPTATHAPEDVPPRRHVEGRTPRFLRHFDVRWDHGPMPGTGGDGLTTRIHLRLNDPSDLGDEVLTVLMADVSPTPATGRFSRPAPASSVSWALELRPLRAPLDPTGWWRADNESLIVGGGYVNHAARVWAPSGELAALAYQVVALYG